jgi:uncharacterized repeat protein (TIGR01451 family)
VAPAMFGDVLKPFTINSYDPNDKQAFPLGFTSNHVVKPGTEMEYLLRFQNTGTDTAYTVTVVDTLDTYLNVESLEIGAISHPYQVDVQTTALRQSILRFRFNNLLLPDSNTNEANSHGFVQFRISPKPGLALGTQVLNRADIYFDFNPAVRTNQTLTTFDNLVFTNPGLDTNVHIVSVFKQTLLPKDMIQVYPNPANEFVTIEGKENVLNVSVIDPLGRVLIIPDSGLRELDIRQLKTGMYWLKIQTRDGVVVKKLMKN